MNEENEPWQRALEYYQAGDLARSEEYCRQVPLGHPCHAEALHLQGIVAYQSGDAESAKNFLRQAIAAAPDFADAFNNLGNILNAERQFDAAIAAYAQALRLNSNRAEIYYNLANTFAELEQLDNAIEAYRNAWRLDPNLIEACQALGNLLHRRGKSDEAIATYRDALKINSENALLHFGLGRLFQDQGNFSQAVTAYQAAIQCNSNYPEACNNLGNSLHEMGRLAEAIEAFRQAIILRPDYAEAHRNLGNVYQTQGEFESAFVCYEKAIQLKPGYGLATLVHQMQHRCRWENIETLAQQVIESIDRDDPVQADNVVLPFCFLSLPIPTTSAQQRRCAERYLQLLGVRSRTDSIRPSPMPHVQVDESVPHSRKKIRLGYLSADFRDHPVAYLISELIEAHDREQFEVFGYSIGPDDQSPHRRRLIMAFDTFRDLQQASHTDAARKIAEDKLDILIDLQGFTQHSRTKILALRPAPIQVNYLGYPGTMGADFIDYILVDEYIVSVDQQSNFAEALAYIPGSYMAQDRHRSIDARTPSRLELGLPESAFVFCGFSSYYKLTPQMFDIWLSLLRDIPESVLWLRDAPSEVLGNLRSWATKREVDPRRLIIASTIPMPAHLARHRVADLFLDTYPYNQHSTASDALRVGLPVLTCSGTTFASRVAGSLLHHLGMDELIAPDLETYRITALDLARQPQKLASIRKKLESSLAATSLYNGRAFTLKLEKLFQQMLMKNRFEI